MEVRVRVKGIKRYRVKGVWYYYHRATGTRLRSPPNSAAFIAEVKRLDENLVPVSPEDKFSPRTKYVSGTWGALVAAYRASPEFTQLAPRTRTDYDKVLDWLARVDDMPLSAITSAACLEFRDEAFRQHKRRFANYCVHMLSVVLGWGKPRGHVAQNAAAGIDKIARPKNAPEPHRPWTREECAAVLSAATGPLKVAIALGMFAGLRRGDVVRVTWNAYDGQNIEFRQGKTGDSVWLPATSSLQAILDTTPRVAVTIIAGANGRPWAEATLSSNFRDLIVKLEGEGRVAPGVTFHGLRNTIAAAIADGEGDVLAIQAALGHRTAQQSLHYARGHSRRRAATAAIRILDRKR